MKWLFRIVVYLFPRKRWKKIYEVDIYDDRASGEMPTGCVIILQDQFGNIKKKRIKA